MKNNKKREKPEKQKVQYKTGKGKNTLKTKNGKRNNKKSGKWENTNIKA